MLDREQVMTLVWNHLKQQGRPSLGRGIHSDRCVYRSRFGDKCAIGVLIRDDVFSTPFNGEPLSSPYVLGMLEDSGWIIDLEGDDLDFLCALQHAHDEHKPGPAWVDHVRQALALVEWRYVPGCTVGLFAEVYPFRQLKIDRAEQPRRVEADRPNDGDEFQHVEPPLQLLDLVHE